MSINIDIKLTQIDIQLTLSIYVNFKHHSYNQPHLTDFEDGAYNEILDSSVLIDVIIRS